MRRIDVMSFAALAVTLALGAIAATVEWGSATAETIGFVQFASDNSVAARRASAEPGVLLATELRDGGSNQVAALTIGTPDATRVRVIDRYALHRTPLEAVEYPDYYIELGEGTSLLDERTVRVFDNLVIPGTGAEPPSLHYTRSFRIVPLNGVSVVRAMLGMIGHPIPGELLPSDAACHLDWICNGDGSVTAIASCSQNSQTLTITLDVEIVSLHGIPTLENYVVDDLTESDYLYIDAYGQTSLGGLRSWVHDRYDPYMANLWAEYPATRPVNLNSQTLRITRNASLRTESTVTTNDTVALYHGMGPVLKSVAGVSATNGLFRIIGFEFSGNDAVLYTTTDVTEPPYAVSTTSLTNPDWQTCANQTTTLGTYKGEPAYVITVQGGASGTGSRFFKAVSASTETGAYLVSLVPLYAKGGICIQSPDGTWWRLTVDNSGNLSATADTSTPEELQ